jgi:hypothetical protein
MRKMYRFISAGALLQGALLVGCWSTYDDYYLPLTDPKLAIWDAGPDGDGGLPVGCDPSAATGAVADSCGVFVSVTGDDSNAGTKAKPLKTLKAALAKGATIYACAGAAPFVEAVAIDKAATLFGALDCSTWIYDASQKTQLTAEADAIPLSLTSAAGGSELHDFAIVAVGATVAGGSSIAVLDDHADLTLDHVDVAAGKGAAGAAGEAQGQVQTPATANGTNGGDNAACTVATIIPGGAGGANACDGTKTDGGNGGKGAPVSVGDQGGDGSPMATPGNGGTGQTKTASCDPGGKGTDGSIGPAGTGARGIGDVSASGYVSPAAMLGGNGLSGQGGGGGGGGRQCDVNGMFAGPSGGGGGAGGCGGTSGAAGQSGGSSVGILALGAKLTLSSVSITTKDGGAGGAGGDGQLGGNGGIAGNAVGGAACNGGKGGQGGAGGPGGGGAGGHSSGIAIKGGQLPDLASTTVMHANAGTGGKGGDMDATAQTKGDDGHGCRTLDFSNPMSPTACAK